MSLTSWRCRQGRPRNLFLDTACASQARLRKEALVKFSKFGVGFDPKRPSRQTSESVTLPTGQKALNLGVEKQVCLSAQFPRGYFPLKKSEILIIRLKTCSRFLNL
ncbi:hypothetical protein E2C01_091992 [Portunus trituberculatus]|uniref:Uncharacterized protein n=1 Tax=Portunus trituberculatus TaxID=210409 RepID=A0A5B7JUB6_PORTR|nr:hypothetical protein [Portunus trituberculatus]